MFSYINNTLNSFAAGASIPHEPQKLSEWAQLNIGTLKAYDQVLNVSQGHEVKIIKVAVYPAPKLFHQNLLDNFYRDYFEPLANHPVFKEINNRLNSSVEGDWYKKLGDHLLKLPFRAARDILVMVYSVISGVIFGVVHPFKGMNKVAELVIQVIEAISHPETYVALGAGAIGTACGQCVFTGLYMPAAVSAAVGAVFLTAGLSYDVIRALIEKKADSTLLWKNLDLITQSFTTGVLTGLVAGYFSGRTVTKILPTNEEAKNQFYKYMAKNNYKLADVAYGGYYPKSEVYLWSWWNPPVDLPASTWWSIDPSKPWNPKIWTYSSINVCKEIVSQSKYLFEQTVAAQAVTAMTVMPTE